VVPKFCYCTYKILHENLKLARFIRVRSLLLGSLLVRTVHSIHLLVMPFNMWTVQTVSKIIDRVPSKNVETYQTLAFPASARSPEKYDRQVIENDVKILVQNFFKTMIRPFLIYRKLFHGYSRHYMFTLQHTADMFVFCEQRLLSNSSRELLNSIGEPDDLSISDTSWCPEDQSLGFDSDDDEYFPFCEDCGCVLSAGDKCSDCDLCSSTAKTCEICGVEINFPEDAYFNHVPSCFTCGGERHESICNMCMSGHTTEPKGPIDADALILHSCSIVGCDPQLQFDQHVGLSLNDIIAMWEAEYTEQSSKCVTGYGRGDSELNRAQFATVLKCYLDAFLVKELRKYFVDDPWRYLAGKHSSKVSDQEVDEKDPNNAEIQVVGVTNSKRSTRSGIAPVLLKFEDPLEGKIICPHEDCKSKRYGIIGSTKGCNVITCTRHNPYFYFCYHCKEECPGGEKSSCKCPKRNSEGARQLAQQHRNANARNNPIDLTGLSIDDSKEENGAKKKKIRSLKRKALG